MSRQGSEGIGIDGRCHPDFLGLALIAKAEQHDSGKRANANALRESTHVCDFPQTPAIILGQQFDPRKRKIWAELVPESN